MNNIIIDIYVNKEELLPEITHIIFNSSKHLIQNIEVSFENSHFTVNEFENALNLMFDSITLKLEIGEVWLRRNTNYLGRICFYDVEYIMLFEIINKLLFNYSDFIVVTYISGLIDFRVQTSPRKKNWEVSNRNIPEYVKFVSNKNSNRLEEPIVISLESLPGHSHIMGYSDKLWFGSCWQMYFSPIYYKYIPKPLWDDFTDCFEHTVFDNGLRKIVLFENPEDFDLEESRAKQWSFRRRLGIDSIAHELTKSSNRVEPDYLPVLITKQDCKLGQTKVTRFLTKDHQLAMSEDLVEFMEVKEYLEDGITVVDEFMVPW